jgi:hypothetical protein
MREAQRQKNLQRQEEQRILQQKIQEEQKQKELIDENSSDTE